MKKIIFAALALFTIGIATASADKNRIIAKENLPQKSQQFINSHFSSIKVSYVKEEYDFFEKSFEVVFADGSKVEFARNGEWKEVDCRYTAVPTPIVPQAIVKYIKSNYPDVKVLQIEKKRSDYEVKISNRLELTFDSKYNIIDIDD
ncbi:MAG: PepSY-like domain-containing protein [Bacteroidaceae bacterium]|nr:PepSY-like domain-containing protein [Bacteroidaceae bacterium]MBR5891446.1 PepSY-like domain-containing protein [Bacteroidaceae bacterium]